MPFSDLITPLRETLGVSASYDNSVILPGISRNAAWLLRNYRFPKSVALFESAPLAADSKTIALPGGGAAVGLIKAVVLYSDDDPPLYKRLKGTLVGEPARSDGPVGYWREGGNIVLDTALAEADYTLAVYYHSVSASANETWLSAEFEDVLFDRTAMRLALELRKPEVAQAFQPLWRDQIQVLATYLNEVEYNDLDIRMMPEVTTPPVERYGR